MIAKSVISGDIRIRYYAAKLIFPAVAVRIDKTRYHDHVGGIDRFGSRTDVRPHLGDLFGRVNDYLCERTPLEMFATMLNYAIMGIAMATFAKLYELKSCFDWFLVGSFIISVYRAFAKPAASKQLDEIRNSVGITSHN